MRNEDAQHETSRSLPSKWQRYRLPSLMPIKGNLRRLLWQCSTRKKRSICHMVEIAGIEPAPLCELTHKGKWSHSSPVTDRCTTLFCRDCTYSLGSARGTDRHILCLLPTVWSATGTDTTCAITCSTGRLEGKRGPFFLPAAPTGGAGPRAGVTITGTKPA